MNFGSGKIGGTIFAFLSIRRAERCKAKPRRAEPVPIKRRSTWQEYKQERKRFLAVLKSRSPF